MKTRANLRTAFFWLVLAGLPAGPAVAAVQLHGLFTDHLVLQRAVAVPVWGTAAPGEKVVVTFAGQSLATSADAQGRWLVRLAPLAASAEARDLQVTGGDGTIVKRHEVVVGEVWLAGGQSNMRYPLFAAHNAAEVLPSARDPLLRFFTVPLRTAVEPAAAMAGAAWAPCTPQSAHDFSAVAFFFARELREKLGCPVGVVFAAWGGTPIETWISLAEIERAPPLARPLAAWEKALRQYREFQAQPRLGTEYTIRLAQWQREVQPAFDAATKAYNTAKDAGQPVGARPTPAWEEPQNPDPMGIPSPSRRPQTPSISFNGMIAPLAPFALRGFLWYQGEANAGAGLEYRTLFPRLIQDWRRHWGGDLPFLFVQLPACYEDPTPVAERGWPWLREAQARTLSEPRTAMAVALDVGDPNNVHPTDKLDVGHRLALVARHEVYGETVVAAGPRFRQSEIQGGRIRVTFIHTDGGLTPGQAPWRARGVEPLPADRLVGFFIAGQDRRWQRADATIEGDAVLVSSPAVPQPVAVRYGWANSPRCNLYNRAGLPAEPFRTDSWDK